jgi:hypothetical protein
MMSCYSLAAVHDPRIPTGCTHIPKRAAFASETLLNKFDAASQFIEGQVSVQMHRKLAKFTVYPGLYS